MHSILRYVIIHLHQRPACIFTLQHTCLQLHSLVRVPCGESAGNGLVPEVRWSRKTLGWGIDRSLTEVFGQRPPELRRSRAFEFQLRSGKGTIFNFWIRLLVDESWTFRKLGRVCWHFGMNK